MEQFVLSCCWKVLRIGTVRYNWPMSAHASQTFSIAQCTEFGRFAVLFMPILLTLLNIVQNFWSNQDVLTKQISMISGTILL